MGKSERIPVYAISDLHLYLEGGVAGMLPSGLVYQAIPVGLIENWRDQVEREAWVLIPGDISDSSPRGAMHADYSALDEWPGQKLLSPGNHEQVTWRSQAKIDRFCSPFPSLTPLVSGGVRRIAVSDDAPGMVIVAAQGACSPLDSWFGDEINLVGPDNPHLRFRRELANLRHGLTRADQIRRPYDTLVVQMHYPPFVNFTGAGVVTRELEEASVDLCIYGHLHQEDEGAFEGERNGVRYRNVAAPRIDMRPLKLAELTADGIAWAI